MREGYRFCPIPAERITCPGPCGHTGESLEQEVNTGLSATMSRDLGAGDPRAKLRQVAPPDPPERPETWGPRGCRPLRAGRHSAGSRKRGAGERSQPGSPALRTTPERRAGRGDGGSTHKPGGC